MAFFKFRLSNPNTGEVSGNTSHSPAESLDALRRRARHRLIGASVLVVLGVVGFPLLFDTQPRPVATDIAVDIPDRASASNKSNKPAPPKPAPLDPAAALDPKEEVVPAKSDAAVVTAQPKPEAKSEAKPEAKPEVKAQEQNTDVKDDAANKETAQRFVVQVGAFADEAKSREVRTKLEKAGFKTYTHVAETKEGKRTRVRVGPFASREEADKVANRIKQLQLQPQILTL